MFQEVTIGVINVLMGLDIFQIMPKSRSEAETLGKAIITTASSLLVLGVLFVHQQHRTNILLIWLIASVLYFGTLIHEIHDDYYYRSITLYIYGTLLVGMQALIYKAYTKELQKSTDKDSNVCEAKNVVEKPSTPTARQESYPPSYETMVPQVHVY